MAATRENPDGPNLADELAAIPYEPLLPVEKRLIGGSLLLGLSLLGVLWWVSHTYFPAPGAPAPRAGAAAPDAR
jgi:hypothetical protein